MSKRIRYTQTPLLFALLAALLCLSVASCGSSESSGPANDGDLEIENESDSLDSPDGDDADNVDNAADNDLADTDKTDDADAETNVETDTDTDINDGDAAESETPTDADIDTVFPDGDTDTEAADNDTEVTDNDTHDSDTSQCGVGDDEKTATSRKVYYGTTSPTLFNISTGQQKAVVALRGVLNYGSEINFCSGTLISDRVVLTAAHCFYGEVSSPDEVTVTIGLNSDQPEATLAIKEFHINSGYDPNGETGANDFTVVILKSSATAAVPSVVPIPISTTALTNAMIGKTVQNAGFGSTQSDENNSKRFWVAEPISAYGDGEFSVNGENKHGVCFGDSGGPSFYDFGAGLRVIGAVSWGDESCVGTDHFADVAAVSSWIASYLSDSEDCGTLTATGICNGDLARWCENNKVVQQDCAATSQVCGSNSQNQKRCVADPCQGLSFEGSCQGTVANWCENGIIKQRHCAPCGQVCGATETLGNYCTDSPLDGDIDTDTDSDGSTDDPCLGLSFEGCCGTDGYLYYCDNSELYYDPCADSSQSCGWAEGADGNGYYCGGSGADPSGQFPKACPDGVVSKRRR